MGAEEEMDSRVSMFKYLQDTLEFLMPAVAFSGAYLVIAVIFASISSRKIDTSQASPVVSAFILAYIRALGGTYSIWPSLLLLLAAVVLSGFSASWSVDLKRTLSEYRWHGLAFCIIYVVCSNYFLRAFKLN